MSHNIGGRSTSAKKPPTFNKKIIKNSFQWHQSMTTPTNTILIHPLGYPDHLYPSSSSHSHRFPSKGLQFEAKMTDLIAPQFLQIDDITVFSSLRKDSFCTISKSQGVVLFMAHKVMAPHVQLPFYKGNPTIIQNGFTIKVKNLMGACVLTFKRKTLFKPNETDILEIWFGNKVIPVGRVSKSPLVNEYLIYGELGQPLHVIYKARAMLDSPDTMKNFKYVIHKMDDKEIVGRINCKRRKEHGPLVDGEYPCHIELNCELDIPQKSLLIGALFLIASRSHSGIERMEEKTRTLLDVETKTNRTKLPKGRQSTNDIYVNSYKKFK